MLKHLTISLLILLCGLAGVNALQPQELQRYVFTEPHMGTAFRIVLYAKDEATAKKAAKAEAKKAKEVAKAEAKKAKEAAKAEAKKLTEVESAKADTEADL